LCAFAGPRGTKDDESHNRACTERKQSVVSNLLLRKLFLHEFFDVE